MALASSTWHVDMHFWSPRESLLREGKMSRRNRYREVDMIKTTRLELKKIFMKFITMYIDYIPK